MNSTINTTQQANDKEAEDFCMLMVDKVFETKEQMTDIQYKSIMEALGKKKKSAEMRTYKLKVLVPMIDIQTGEEGCCDLDFKIFDVYEYLSKEFIDKIMNSGGKIRAFQWKQLVSINNVLEIKGYEWAQFSNKYRRREDCLCNDLYAKIISAEEV